MLNSRLLPDGYYAMAELLGGCAMPMHDWTTVNAGIYHHFHNAWIQGISLQLNSGVLPKGHYALTEQITSGLGPDVVTLDVSTNGHHGGRTGGGSIALATAAPKVSFRQRSEVATYAAKAKTVTIRHSSNHRVVAVIEIVSPGNKDREWSVRTFVKKAAELLRAGVHLAVIDPFPPGKYDLNGIHDVIWKELDDCQFVPPPDLPLTLVSYVAFPALEAFIEPTAVGATLVDMPVFLDEENYVPVPLEMTYQAAWEAVPEFWREQLTKAGTS